MHVPHLPVELFSIIVSYVEVRDRLSLRKVNHFLCGEVDDKMHGYEKELREMLASCRISSKTMPKKWLMRYTYECNRELPVYVCAKCYSNVSEIGSCDVCSKTGSSSPVPRPFPWRQALQGPVLTFVIVMACVLF